ncbi:hypothetical protein [Archangium lansingense]|uniref:Uncharacterized protein n=1 Tax=Archangium lansingense TaxID=2995310 RepID=A0ABT4A3V8_9BACT|nr:hypothetical protein [Archangium lansinium]MCY1076338.1 hypothetical protein [Archangium lansinium]
MATISGRHGTARTSGQGGHQQPNLGPVEGASGAAADTARNSGALLATLATRARHSGRWSASARDSGAKVRQAKLGRGGGRQSGADGHQDSSRASGP